MTEVNRAAEVFPNHALAVPRFSGLLLEKKLLYCRHPQIEPKIPHHFPLPPLFSNPLLTLPFSLPIFPLPTPHLSAESQLLSHQSRTSAAPSPSPDAVQSICCRRLQLLPPLQPRCLSASARPQRSSRHRPPPALLAQVADCEAIRKSSPAPLLTFPVSPQSGFRPLT